MASAYRAARCTSGQKWAMSDTKTWRHQPTRSSRRRRKERRRHRMGRRRSVGRGHETRRIISRGGKANGRGGAHASAVPHAAFLGKERDGHFQFGFIVCCGGYSSGGWFSLFIFYFLKKKAPNTFLLLLFLLRFSQRTFDFSFFFLRTIHIFIYFLKWRERKRCRKQIPILFNKKKWHQVIKTTKKSNTNTPPKKRNQYDTPSIKIQKNMFFIGLVRVNKQKKEKGS